MNNLTEKDIEFITQIINNSSIKSVQMKEDLIDHFCCAVEEEMKKGKSFSKSYDMAYQYICPDGFDEIQRETVFLLTFKKIKRMKRLLYLSGYLSAIGITTSFFMKLNHIAGAQIAFLVTTALFVLVFLPALFVNLYKRDLTKSTSDKLKYVFGFLGILIFILSVLFKISHWPGATMIFLSSVVIINFLFFPLLFFKMYRKSVK